MSPDQLKHAYLAIADDVPRAARVRAQEEGKSTGEIISELARSALNAPPATLAARAPKALHGLRSFPKCGGIVTNELIDKLREEEAE